MKKTAKWFVALAIMGSLAGCSRTAPVAQIHTTVTAGHTEAQVRTAILKAGILILPTNNGHMAKRGSVFQIVPG